MVHRKAAAAAAANSSVVVDSNKAAASNDDDGDEGVVDEDDEGDDDNDETQDVVVLPRAPAKAPRVQFDTLQITPGTRFMTRLTSALSFYCASRVANFQNIPVEFVLVMKILFT